MVDAEYKVCMICEKKFDRTDWVANQSKSPIVKIIESICPECRIELKALIKPERNKITGK